MKEIKFNGNTYSCPESWDEVTIGMQQEVESVASIQKHVRMLGVIAGYTGIPIKELKEAKILDVNQVMESLTFMKDKIPPNKELKWEFEGQTYKVDKNVGDMEFQDFVSIQTILSDYKDRYYDALPILCAILAKREGEKLDDYDPIERAETFKKMPLSVATSIAAFFLLKGNYSKVATHLSSPIVQRNILRAKVNDIKATLSPLGQERGGKLRTRLLLGILRLYMKFLERRLRKYYNSMQLEFSTINSKPIYLKSLEKKRKREQKINKIKKLFGNKK